MFKIEESRKVVTRVVTLILLITSVALMFHLFKSARELHASENSKATADAAEAALQYKQSFAAYSPAPVDAFSTPDGWEKLAALAPDLDLAKEAKILALLTKDEDAAPAGWERITDATQLPLPALEPASTFALPVPPLQAEPASGQGSTDESSEQTSPSFNEKFPTNQRVWTNYRGQLMVASILKCDFKTGKLLMESDKGILRNYLLTQLSDADRAYLWSLTEEE